MAVSADRHDQRFFLRRELIADAPKRPGSSTLGRFVVFAAAARGWLACIAAQYSRPKDSSLMKQSAAKTLGIAALGAAFAAAAAGTASAAPTALPDSATSLDTVSSILPVQEAVTKLPAAPESLAGGQQALIGSATTLPAAVQEAAAKGLPTTDHADPVSGLLGGLPVGGAAGGLPAGLPGGLPGLG
jgi:hypothetical protein